MYICLHILCLTEKVEYNVMVSMRVNDGIFILGVFIIQFITFTFHIHHIQK